jgi:hypothetical protein
MSTAGSATGGSNSPGASDASAPATGVFTPAPVERR